jgi:serine/threonine-protein kinase
VKPDRFARLRELLLKVADLSENERKLFLEEACKDDPQLKAEIESLLSHDSDQREILEPAGMIPGSLRDLPQASTEDSLIGRTISHYEILEKLGEGGMGAVYRGLDTTLRREIALKTLPDRFTQDPERVARLQREARALASLQHPNIASIFGFEEADGRHFLIMELVEGEDLARRLHGGALSVDESLETALQIAEGLEAAHEQGIVHRDLKPTNVRATPEGKVKILDFGLARAYQPESAAGKDTDDSPSFNTDITKSGMILGTAAYMSPDQARGKPVDWRADIWAFGCVLYEMLTGKRPFSGETASDTLAVILEREPDWERLPKSLPRGIRQLLRRCLTKDVRNRLQAIGDARIAIEECIAEPSRPVEEPVAPQPIWRRVALWVLLPLVAVGVWILKPEQAHVPAPDHHLEIPLPEGTRLTSEHRHALALSPDGRTLAFVAGTASDLYGSDTCQIHLRSLDGWGAPAVAGTENGIQPFFSPDGEWLGFIRDSQLMKVAVAGGEPVTLCRCVRPCGASWGPDGTIVFAGVSGGLYLVSDSGGEPDTLTRLDRESGEISHRLPHFLPNGKAVLFTALYHEFEDVDWNRARIYVQSLETGERKLLIEGGSDARYLSTGHLVFAREGRLFAVRFGLNRLEVVGSETRVLDGVSHSTHTYTTYWETGAAHFTVSTFGTLAYAPGSIFPEVETPVAWVDRQGREELLEVEPKQYFAVRVSPDGRRILLTELSFSGDVWLYDLERRVQRRQTFEGDGSWAIWGPEADCFTVDSDLEGPRVLYWKEVDSGPGGMRRLSNQPGGTTLPGSWSADGEELAFVAKNLDSGNDIWTLSRDGRSEPILSTRFNEAYPELSPDGRWLVYTSNESGRSEVYVRPYPGPGRPVQISTDGGSGPAWSRDGREIFYRKLIETGSTGVRLNNILLAVPIAEDGDFLVPGRPQELFQGFIVAGSPLRAYDVAPDGRFLLVKYPDDSALTPIIDKVFPTRIRVVQNWFAELEETLSNSE